MTIKTDFKPVELPDSPLLSEMRDIADELYTEISEIIERWHVIKESEGRWGETFYEARCKELTDQAFPSIRHAETHLGAIDRDTRKRQLEVMRPEHYSAEILESHVEIRASLRGLNDSARKKILDAALKDVDSLTLSAVTNGRYFLSGITSAESHATFTKKAFESLTNGEFAEINEQQAAIATVNDYFREASELIETMINDLNLADSESGLQEAI